MKNNKFIVLTGGSGSIGKEIVKFLKEQERIVDKIILLEEQKINGLKNLYSSFHSDLSSGKILL